MSIVSESFPHHRQYPTAHSCLRICEGIHRKEKKIPENVEIEPPEGHLERGLPASRSESETCSQVEPESPRNQQKMNRQQADKKEQGHTEGDTGCCQHPD